MTKIVVEIDDTEIITLVKEAWYKRVRYDVSKQLREVAACKCREFMDKDDSQEFKEIFAEAVKDVLKQFSIRDLKHIEKMLGYEKKTKKPKHLNTS